MDHHHLLAVIYIMELEILLDNDNPHLQKWPGHCKLIIQLAIVFHRRHCSYLCGLRAELLFSITASYSPCHYSECCNHCSILPFRLLPPLLEPSSRIKLKRPTMIQQIQIFMATDWLRGLLNRGEKVTYKNRKGEGEIRARWMSHLPVINTWESPQTVFVTVWEKNTSRTHVITWQAAHWAGIAIINCITVQEV